jgi:hypothetical protein
MFVEHLGAVLSLGRFGVARFRPDRAAGRNAGSNRRRMTITIGNMIRTKRKIMRMIRCSRAIARERSKPRYHDEGKAVAESLV